MPKAGLNEAADDVHFVTVDFEHYACGPDCVGVGRENRELPPSRIEDPLQKIDVRPLIDEERHAFERNEVQQSLQLEHAAVILRAETP